LNFRRGTSMPSNRLYLERPTWRGSVAA
jgi:hypothetical protein